MMGEIVMPFPRLQRDNESRVVVYSKRWPASTSRRVVRKSVSPSVSANLTISGAVPYVEDLHNNEALASYKF